ncbi:hypothetical protein QM565_24360 [Geitlerinema splendidum]|nr:hypothetical protein [Geitlerinema splendidum]
MSSDAIQIEEQWMLHECVTCFRLARTEQIVQFSTWIKKNPLDAARFLEIDDYYLKYASETTKPLNRYQFEGGCQLFRLAS